MTECTIKHTHSRKGDESLDNDTSCWTELAGFLDQYVKPHLHRQSYKRKDTHTYITMNVSVYCVCLMF